MCVLDLKCKNSVQYIPFLILFSFNWNSGR